MRDDSWMVDAACRGAEKDLFHSDDLDDIRRAKAICASCPHTQECLRWAYATKSEGIAAGLTHKERRKLSRHIAQGRITLNEWNMTTKITVRKKSSQ